MTSRGYGCARHSFIFLATLRDNKFESAEVVVTSDKFPVCFGSHLVTAFQQTENVEATRNESV